MINLTELRAPRTGTPVPPTPATDTDTASIAPDDVADPFVDLAPEPPAPVVFRLEEVSVSYGDTPAVADVTVDLGEHEITAISGPSGCGKSTLLRSLNRMHDSLPDVRINGRITYRDVDLYGPAVNPVEVRRRIGMVFQKPNPFPKSIYDNVAFGPRVIGRRSRADLDHRVERALRDAALWSEVHHRLGSSAMALSGGQQQRLCIARALAIEPDVLLMDEPCSALDPIATHRIEDLLTELKHRYTIVIVTHNMQQAARISDRTIFFTTEVDDGAGDLRCGRLVEHGPTVTLFSTPADPRTLDYVTGRFG
ncbi:phosphate ABC transporter ATP-binding protein PstB [soil metagenome]